MRQVVCRAARRPFLAGLREAVTRPTPAHARRRAREGGRAYAGRSCGALDLVCQLDNNGEIIDPLFAIVHGFLVLAVGDNDGLVPVDSAQWGDYQGVVPADHMDEVGQIADVFNPAFDHKDFFLGEIRRLAALGH